MTLKSILACRRGGLFAAVLAVAISPANVSAQEPPEEAPPGSTLPEPAPAPPLRQQSPLPGPEADKQPRSGKGQSAEKDAPAETTPEQHAKLLAELYTRLASAPDEETAVEIANAIEQLWQHSGSATADLLVARAAAATEAQRRELAMKLLNTAVELRPDYAEAWNRRAYLFYLEDDYKRALGDIRRVLALEPRHFKALEGLANILQQLGEKKAALEAYDSLLKIHPKMPGASKARDDLRDEVEGQGI